MDHIYKYMYLFSTSSRSIWLKQCSQRHLLASSSPVREESRSRSKSLTTQDNSYLNINPATHHTTHTQPHTILGNRYHIPAGGAVVADDISQDIRQTGIHERRLSAELPNFELFKQTIVPSSEITNIDLSHFAQPV